MSKPFNFRGSINDSAKEHIFYYAEVLDITDDAGAGRIKARIKLVDDVYKTDAELPWSYPLIPRFFNVVPKKGEGVQMTHPGPLIEVTEVLYLVRIKIFPTKIKESL